VGKQDRVFLLTGRILELYIAALGTWKNTSVFCPLFSAFGPEPIRQRLTKGDAKVLVTTERLFHRKIIGLLDHLPSLQYVILVDADEHLNTRVVSWSLLMKEASDEFTISPTDPEDMAILHFTSGTTGMPKGAIHAHQAVLTHYITGKYVLDLHPEDTYWCTADPGWVTGTSYGIIAPLTHGVTSIIDEADFDTERWYNILEQQQVSVWYTAPTAVRMLMRSSTKPKDQLNRLRLIHSVGEPLNPEAISWAQKALGMPIYDNWWQTETGGIMISNFASVPIKPGSMGRPLPGIEAAVVERVDDQHVKALPPGEIGDLALKPGWPSMFRGYLHEEERYKKCFVDGWYITGDLAKQDEEGYFWFVGRADDIIKTSGHMVGPFEVESALMEHPAVAEAAVIGIPDTMIGELVKAYVALKPGTEPSEELSLDIKGFARKKLGSAVAPKVIEFSEDMPRTRSGKIMRRLLKARALGLPEGDTSTLENKA
jgi:acetyl-CoA synthetase